MLKGINLLVPENSIFGFLGVNGAGKSTTIRILLGLIGAQPDSVFLFGREFTRNKIDLLSRVGALIDYPTFYDHLSANENLNVIITLLGLPKRKAQEMIELVGLNGVQNKKIKTFSVGMKQRLGLAMALLNNPPLLILDEPTNGLDPVGIIEFRKLLITLQRDHGKTIFLSSHILDELEKVATDIAIIHNGEIRFQGSKEALISATGNLETSFLTLTS